MAATRRVGTATSKTRARLLDATEQLMLEDGYAAVSSRSVAAGAGVKAPLVHYYFPTLDDLFIAAFRRRSERHLERLTAALEGDDPLQALWDYANDKAHVALTLEFLAIANHRKAIQAELAEVAVRFRKVELEAFTAVAVSAGIDLDEFPPDALLLIMMAIPTVVVLEESLGMSTGHEHALLLVERYLSQLRGAPLRRGTASRRAAKPTKRATAAKKPATPTKKATKPTTKATKTTKSARKAASPRRRRS
jgi:AcrR family transcriptional regulator